MSDKLLLKVKPSIRLTYVGCGAFLLASISSYELLQEVGLGNNVPAISVILIILALAYSHLLRFFTLYQISEEYIQTATGIIARRGTRAALSRVTDFSASQKILQRLLFLADVTVSTAGSSDSEFKFKNVTTEDAKRIVAILTERTAANKPTAEVKASAAN